LMVVAGVGNSAFATKPIEIVSPDRAVRFELSREDGRLQYEGFFQNKTVIETSPLAITVDGIDLTARVEVGRVKRFTVKETYPWRGVHSRATIYCKGATISLRHDKSDTPYALEVRGFNDVCPFRHIIPGIKKTRVPDEATAFVLPSGSTVWYHNLEGHYEAVHQKKDVAEIQAGEWAAPPVAFKLPAKTGSAAITEAALVNYSGMALQADGHRGFSLVLGHKHHVSYPFRLRYSNDVERVSRPTAISGPITTPWRVVMVGRDLN